MQTGGLLLGLDPPTVMAAIVVGLKVVVAIAGLWLLVKAWQSHRRIAHRGHWSSLVLLLLGLQLLIIAAGSRYRIGRASMHACYANLRQLAGAIKTWVVETKEQAGTKVTMNDLKPYFVSGTPQCPAGGAYLLTVDRPPRCSVHDVIVTHDGKQMVPSGKVFEIVIHLGWYRHEIRWPYYQEL